MTREEAIEWLKKSNPNNIIGISSVEHRDIFYKRQEAFDMAIEVLKQKPKMGRWMAVDNEDMHTVDYFCSECDLPLETAERTPFCPNCGAKMRESEE